MTPPAFTPLGDAALRAPLPAGADARRVLDTLKAVRGVVDVIVGERHVAVVLAEPPCDAALAGVLAAALERATTPDHAASPPLATRTHRIAVRYDGPDLAEVAARAGVRPDDVVAMHAARTYVVDRMGFLPGFAYLRDVDPRIAQPRRATPRPRVAPASVGIAGSRTGIYPFESPGGWNLVGTAVGFAAFDAERGAALALGDRVVFEPLP